MSPVRARRARSTGSMSEAARSEGRESLYGFVTVTGGMSTSTPCKLLDEEWREDRERGRRWPKNMEDLEGTEVFVATMRGVVPLAL